MRITKVINRQTTTKITSKRLMLIESQLITAKVMGGGICVRPPPL